MTTSDPRPGCQCLERGEALRRAREALFRGDSQTWQKEMVFVKNSMVEDALALKEWTMRQMTQNKDSTT